MHQPLDRLLTEAEQTKVREDLPGLLPGRSSLPLLPATSLAKQASNALALKHELR